jgi:hypothetical protein
MTFKDWFAVGGNADAQQRTVTVFCRMFGIDFTLGWFGYINDWVIVDLRAPINYGVMLQVGFILAHVGRLPEKSE